ncbi:alaserpin-like [Cataglyphis hispanica]|uniref:alaserpin-like n=1 Tax=Cataglyphis hispanica TaxID=1086592 RepID=UPI002180885F|nr:alaserpin-like [Cataglyphis hispanica]
MRIVLFAVIIANIVCGFDAFFDNVLFSSETKKSIFSNLSTAIVTYVELKDVSSLKEPYKYDLLNAENIIFSKTSLQIILPLLINGARKGSTKNELMSCLQSINNEIPLNKKYKSELTFLNNFKNVDFHIENAIYVHKSINLRAHFSSICINKFHCSISKVDFKNRMEVAETINSWVQETTNNEILHAISPVNINEDAKIILVNTVYLNTRLPNLKEKVMQRKFHVSPSNWYYVPTIKFEKSTFFYGEILHLNTKFIEIPFLNNKISMIIFLPNKNMEPGNLEYLIKIFSYKYKEITNTYIQKFEQNMELYLPKFTIQCTEDMTDLLHSTDIFTMFEDKADFTRFSKIPLKVNNIVQKVSMRIKEEDSTIPEVKRREKKSVDSPQELIVDRPFFYIIVINGKWSFVGAVRKPDFILTRDEL